MEWGPTNYQLATLIDMVGSRWAGRKWKRLPRPKAKAAKQVGMPVEEKRRRLLDLRRREKRRQADG